MDYKSLNWDNPYFNGKYANDLNLFVTSPPPIPIPYEEKEIKNRTGKNSAYVMNTNIYPPLSIPVKFALVNDDYYIDNIIYIISWITDIKENRLKIFYINTYYNVLKIECGDIQESLKNWGEFAVNFIIEPFRYDFKNDLIDITNLSSYAYFGTGPGEIQLEIYGDGNIQVSFNSEIIEIRNMNGYVILDSKKMTCKNLDGSDKELDMIGDYPVLKNGKNTILKTGNISKMLLRPRTCYK